MSVISFMTQLFLVITEYMLPDQFLNSILVDPNKEIGNHIYWYFKVYDSYCWFHLSTLQSQHILPWILTVDGAYDFNNEVSLDCWIWRLCKRENCQIHWNGNLGGHVQFMALVGFKHPWMLGAEIWLMVCDVEFFQDASIQQA